MSISPAIPNQTRRINSEIITLRLSEMMRRGEIHILPGGRLPSERELAKSLGVSLLTLRNGIRSLTTIGILRSQPGIGTFVVDSGNFKSFNVAPLRLLTTLHAFSSDDLFEARLTLEIPAAVFAAERAANEDLTLMAEEITEMFASLDEPELFLLHNIRFHQAIAAASQNKILNALVHLVTTIFFEERCKAVNRAADLKKSAKMQFEIYRAIRERNPEAAGNTMRDYLIKTKRFRKLKCYKT